MIPRYVCLLFQVPFVFSNSKAMNEEKKKVAKVLRSLIISSPQRGKSLRELIRDFYEFEGKKIPIFEHRTVEDFLRGTGEFIIENFRGELIVYEKPKAERFLHFCFCYFCIEIIKNLNFSVPT